MSNVETELARLLDEVPLPPGWGIPQQFVEVVRIGELELHSVGLVASAEDGREVFGSAAELQSAPLRRAYFELFERAAVLDALAQPADAYPLLDETGATIGECTRSEAFPQAADSDPWAFAKSNGVAAGADWVNACRSARAELVERHGVLSAWYGFTQPVAVSSPEDRPYDLAGDLYDVEYWSFPPPEGAGLDVVGVFAFPKAQGAPLVYGFAADVGVSAARTRALRECLQRLAFLWGETIPSEAPPFSKTPDHHQETYLWPANHQRLRAWLAGHHVGKATRTPHSQRSPESGAASVQRGFVDLTPPHLASRQASLRVVKALSPFELPLTFGRGHPWLSIEDEALLVHPIA